MKKRLLWILPFLCLTILGLTSCDEKEVENTEQTQDVEDKSYKTTVVYPNNTPVSGVAVQWCDTTCSAPVLSDANGVASISSLKDGTYYVHLINLPEGYTYNPNGNVSTSQNRSIIIQLIQLSTLTSIRENEYSLKEGAFNISLKNKDDLLLFEFTADSIGEYSIESYAVDKLAINEIDPAICYFGNDYNNLSSSPLEKDDGGVGKNFKYSFTVTQEDLTANKKWYFGIYISKVTNLNTMYPAEFCIHVTKK